MQNPTPATAATPVAPSAQPVLAQIQGPTRPITPREASIIREQRSEMSNQLTSAQGRREEILDELRNAPPGTEQGLRDQYQVLSDRIVAIENDMEVSGRMLRTGQVPQTMTLVPPRSFEPGRGGSDNAERGAAIGATILVPVLVIYMIAKLTRRRRRRGNSEQQSTDHDLRMERLEQAVDAIALEIERVGESQRYQAKLLAEANMMPAMGGAQKEPVRAREYDR